MLTELQRRKLTRYFRVFDVDDDGRIAPADFERVIENVLVLHGLASGSPEGVELREAYMGRWRALARSADADGDGTVDRGEFLGYWSALLEADVRYQEEILAVTERLLRVFDTDGDGGLGPDEFCDLYGVFGLRAALAREVFTELDRDGDGRISRDELLEMADQFYRGDEPDAPGNKLFGPY